MYPTPPPTPDWPWLTAQGPKCLEWAATQPHGHAWLRKAYAWYHARLPEAERFKWQQPRPDCVPEGPPDDHFPVLAASENGPGALAFATVRFVSVRPPVGADDTVSPMQRVASEVATWFRSLSHVRQWPLVKLSAGFECGGASGALSALVLTLGAFLGVTWPDDVCATGCWRDGALAPVSGDTLDSKIEAVRLWGYHRVLVVEGQDGIPDVADMQLLTVSSSPVEAALSVLRYLLPDAADEKMAQLLAVFDQQAVRGNLDGRDVDRVLDATNVFVAERTSPLAMHVARDMRSRTLTHVGRTAEADRERRLADQCAPDRKPDGWLGDYLRWHQPAHHAILAIDQGDWDEASAPHQRVDEVIRRLDDQLDGNRELLACMFLRNTRGRCYEFLGRMQHDLSLLRKAWQDRVHFRDQWSELMTYAMSLQLNDADIRRQHNQCMDVLASFWEWERRLPDEWGWREFAFWPDGEPCPLDDGNSFDIAAWLRWKCITGQDIPAPVVAGAIDWASEKARHAGNVYPIFLVFETILRYEPGDAAIRQRAAELLAQSELFSPDLPPRSILTLLAIRAEQLVRRASVDCPVLVAPDLDTKLADLARQLREKPETVLARCPY